MKPFGNRPRGISLDLISQHEKRSEQFTIHFRLSSPFLLEDSDRINDLVKTFRSPEITHARRIRNAFATLL